jgi:predicted enzyme related to lactoylglutathione lyase
MAKFDKYEQGTPSWIEHSSSDQKASKEFYGQLFGWDFDDNPMTGEDGEDMGTYSIATIEGDSIAGLGPVMGDSVPPSWGVYLATEDVDAAVGQAQGAGGQLLAGPMDIPEQGRMAWVADPTGAAVGLWQEQGFAGSQRANEPGTNIWNEVVTPDFDKAAPFYAATLGMGTEQQQMPDGSGAYSMLTVGGRTVAGSMTPQVAGVPPHWNVYFNVDDVDASVAKAKDLGAQEIHPAFDVEGIGRMAVLADPQGAAFNLLQAPPG